MEVFRLHLHSYAVMQVAEVQPAILLWYSHAWSAVSNTLIILSVHIIYITNRHHANSRAPSPLTMQAKVAHRCPQVDVLWERVGGINLSGVWRNLLLRELVHALAEALGSVVER